ncbi:MAG: cytochrome c [Actinomycetota bacterium]|nr:cytochrome c [Actinomycetota bacterium]
MNKNELITIVVAVIVPAALLWAIFVARMGRPGRAPRPRLGIPQALRPGQPDEVLEGPRLERIQVWGLVTTLVLAVFIPVYWLEDPSTQTAFAAKFADSSVERGKVIFEPPGQLPPNADPLQFKEIEKSISLGMGCSNCHGAGGVGGQNQFKDPVTGKDVLYNVPPLNNVFTRWDDEVVEFTIERGRPGTDMPTWGVQYGGPMTAQMVADVMAYLHSLPGNRTPPTLAENATGKQIFAARCAVCHGPKGQGKEDTSEIPLPTSTTNPPETAPVWYQGMALWKGDVRHLTPELHYFTIVNGRRFAFMPAFGKTPAQGIPAPPYPLTDDQIKAVMKYERNDL